MNPPTSARLLWGEENNDFTISSDAVAQFGESLCTACGGPGALRCGRCRTPYCSPACQTAAWPLHRKACKAAAAAMSASGAATADLPVATASGIPRLAVTPTERGRNLAALRRAADKCVRPSEDSLIGNCQLFTAIREHDLEKVKAYLAFGQDVNGRWECTSREHAAEMDVGGMSPLTFALAHRASVEIIRTLIDVGADMHHFALAPGFTLGTTPLHTAASAGNVAGVRLLLSRGADARSPLRVSPMTALHCLENAEEGDAIQIAHALLDAGADVNALDQYLETALYQAVVCNRPRLATVLLSRGATPNAVNNKGMRAFDVATTRVGREWAVDALLKAGASVEPVVFSAFATIPLGSDAAAKMKAAAQAGKRLRVEGGVEFATTWPFLCVGVGISQSVLPAVLSAGLPSAARLSVAAAVEPGPGRRSLLAYAAHHGDTTVVQVLLRCGADPNAADAFGRGTLWWALRSGDERSVDALLAAGARALPVPLSSSPARHVLFGRVAAHFCDSTSSTEVNCDETCLATRAEANAVGPLLSALSVAGLARAPGVPCPGCDMLVLQMLGMALTLGLGSVHAFVAAVKLGYGAAEGGARGGLPSALAARFCRGTLTFAELRSLLLEREAALGRAPGSSDTIAALCPPLFLIALASGTLKDAPGLASLATAATTLTAAMGFTPGDGTVNACVGFFAPAEIIAQATMPGAVPVKGNSPIGLVKELHRDVLSDSGRHSGAGSESATQKAERKVGLERLMACLLGLGSTASGSMPLKDFKA